MISYVAETGSTNADLIALSDSGQVNPDGQWLVADRQTKGRGRQGRKWENEIGNFMGSTALRIKPSDPPAHSLSFVASLALYDVIRKYINDTADLVLKWPNDILLNGAKLSGILLERARDTVIIGIGVNLVWAPDIPGRSTASLKSAGVIMERDRFAEELAAQWMHEIALWRREGIKTLYSRWLSYAHPVGTRLSVHDGDKTRLSGRFAGIDPQGSLRLRMADGQVQTIHAGDVIIN